MTTLAFLAGLALGGFTVGWAARYQIREIKADALRLLSARHSLNLTADDIDAAVRGDV